MTKVKSLGKNIENLFSPSAGSGAKFGQSIPTESYHEQVKMIGLEHITPSTHQPRTDFDDEKINELAISIKNQGVIQPIILKQDKTGIYTIIAGERRYRAALQVGLKKIPAIIRNYSEQDASLVALIENIQREDLNPLDKAQAFYKISTDYKLKQQELASILGISRAQLSNSIRLLKVHQLVREALLNKDISEGHAKVLAGLEHDAQEYYLLKIKKSNLSVRQLEDLIERDSFESEKPTKGLKPDPYLEKLKNNIENQLLTKVDIADNGKGKGKVVLYYNSYDELQGLFEKISPGAEVF